MGWRQTFTSEDSIMYSTFTVHACNLRLFLWLYLCSIKQICAQSEESSICELDRHFSLVIAVQSVTFGR